MGGVSAAFPFVAKSLAKYAFSWEEEKIKAKNPNAPPTQIHNARAMAARAMSQAAGFLLARGASRRGLGAASRWRWCSSSSASSSSGFSDDRDAAGGASVASSPNSQASSSDADTGVYPHVNAWRWGPRATSPTASGTGGGGGGGGSSRFAQTAAAATPATEEVSEVIAAAMTPFFFYIWR